MFSKETYQSRRKSLTSSFQKGLILLVGNSESPMNYADNTYHFRQDSTFLYFSGIKRDNLAIVMDVEQNTALLFGEDYTIDSIVWMGPQPTIAEEAAMVGLNFGGDFEDLRAYLKKQQDHFRIIRYLPPYRRENRHKLSQWLGIKDFEIEKRVSVELIKTVVNLRNYKSEEEIQEIEKAVNTSVDMHTAAMRMVKPGLKEQDIAGEVMRIAKAAGGNTSFPIIATINGQTLHNHYHGNTLKEGDMFLLDCGAETALGYAGDLSSTFPVGSKFTPIQEEIYNITLEAHNAAVDMLRPGTYFADCHVKACTVIAQGMKDMGFLNGNIQDAVEQGAHAMFFQCGLGHMMGLDVHDMEDLGEQYVGYDGMPRSTMFGYKSLRLARKLEPGFVLTIEPGIYFIPELMQKWKKEGKFEKVLNYDKLWEFRNFGGIRNEEDFLITANGKRLLGKPKPKTLAQVYQLREQAYAML